MGGLASTVGSMVGIGGSAAAQGMNWAPNATPILAPVTSDQATQAYQQSQQGIANQQAFLNALQAQNGISNQSQVYNQLQGVANGTGPNPAQAMLSQATGANTANQAALMAGQRGAGQNVGLIARQAAQQGAANQQNAAGQAATMQANQSLGALNQLGSLSSQQVGQQAAATGALTGAQQSEQQLLYGQIANQNSANVQQQMGLNQANLAQSQAGAKAQMGLLQGAATGLAMAKGGAVPHYASGAWVQDGPTVGGAPDPAIWASKPSSLPQVQQPSGAPTAPPTPTKFAKATATALGNQDSNANDPYKSENSAGQAIGTGIGKGLSGLGGSIKGLFGGSPSASQSGYQADPATMANLDWGKAPSMDINPNAANGDWANLAKGGAVPAMVSPGEVYLSPEKVDKVAEGKASPLDGEKIKGKAKVKGDSLKNDTVPKTLEEGGIVLPRSVTESKHPHWAAHKFVQQIMAQGGFPKKGDK